MNIAMTTPPDTELAPVQIEAIYNLLGAVVLADGRIRPAEIEAHVQSLERIFAQTGQARQFERSAVTAWLLENATSIRAQMIGKWGQSWLGRQIMLLEGLPITPTVLQALTNIALSDDELHASEAELVELAMRLWKPVGN